MYTRTYKTEGPELTLLGLGCMRLPTKAEGDKTVIDEEKALAMVDVAYKSGINYYDTAYFYHDGASESFMGKALARYPRESLHIATKMPISFLKEEADLERIFNEQLDKLQTDYFDFYLCHALSADGFAKMEKLGTYEFLARKKAEGKIRRLGFSFHDSPEVLKTIVDAHEWDFVQIQLNYLDWEMQRAGEQYQVLTDAGLPVVVMEPVRGGALADLGEEGNAVLKAARPNWSPASWALRYVASLPNVMMVLSGMSSMEQLTDNIATFGDDFAPLTEAEQAVLAEALAAFRKRTFVPCTGCKYCSECPMSIDIPTVFTRYNQYALHKHAPAFAKHLEALPEGSRPADCLSCGLCAERCPQHIAIPELMSRIADITAL